MTNPFDNITPGLSGPARDIVPITPSDSLLLDQVAVSLYVETGGQLRFVTVAGQTRELSLPDFTVLPVGARQILATGTTASGIHGFVIS